MKMNFENKKVAILGWGINGLDAAIFLLRENAIVSILDRKNEKDLDFSGFDRKKVKIIAGINYLENGLAEYDYIFRAPGVYRYIPEIVNAEKKGVKITSVVKLFFDLCPGRIIGVTGTKGKGTTSTLVYQILKNSGEDVYLAGNIGEPILELLPKITNKSWIVLELSSFQLIDMTKSPHIAVVLNITEDHMDWHKDRREYIEAKSQIVRYQRKDDYAVVSYDYEDSKAFSNITKGRVFYFSNLYEVNGCYLSGNEIILNTGQKVSIGKSQKLLLRGMHNRENVTAAITASYLAGADTDSIKKTVYSFKGLEHRLELVREYDEVKFYNDSFSTNPQTTIAAIKSFSEPQTLILGGSDKGLNYNDMGKEIKDSDNVVNIILIGDISSVIENSLIKAGYQGNIVKLGISGMKHIIKKCLQITPKGGVVLLSPATASFDMFKDYKDRGNQFKNEVNLLKSTS